jgi:hypothetical protein
MKPSSRVLLIKKYVNNFKLWTTLLSFGTKHEGSRAGLREGMWEREPFCEQSEQNISRVACAVAMWERVN